MGKFFKENRLYILLPIVLVPAAVIALVVMGAGKVPEDLAAVTTFRREKNERTGPPAPEHNKFAFR